MPARRLAACALALALAGACGGTDGDRPAAPQSWREVEATLGPHLEPSSPNPCQSGEPACFDLVLGEMRRRAERLAAACDHDALFALMYLRTTEAIRDVASDGAFGDPRAVAHVAAWFARFYFDAYDAWHAGRRDDVPGAWRISFEAADRREVRAMGNLLLGLNAHIGRDLAFAVAETAPAPGQEVDPDFRLVSEIIRRISGDVVLELADRFDPTLRAAALPLELDGARTLGELVDVWRLEAWHNGMALLRADGDRREALAAGLEADSRARALLVLPAVAYLPVVEGPEERDAHCAAADA